MNNNLYGMIVCKIHRSYSQWMLLLMLMMVLMMFPPSLDFLFFVVPIVADTASVVLAVLFSMTAPTIIVAFVLSAAIYNPSSNVYLSSSSSTLNSSYVSSSPFQYLPSYLSIIISSTRIGVDISTAASESIFIDSTVSISTVVVLLLLLFLDYQYLPSYY